jgi:hypothetical protein
MPDAVGGGGSGFVDQDLERQALIFNVATHRVSAANDRHEAHATAP